MNGSVRRIKHRASVTISSLGDWRDAQDSQSDGRQPRALRRKSQAADDKPDSGNVPPRQASKPVLSGDSQPRSRGTEHPTSSCRV